MKRTIGIDINKRFISLVQLCSKGGKIFLEKTFIREISNAESRNEVPSQEIQAAVKDTIEKEGFDTRAKAIISMPYGKVFFYNYKTEIASDRDIEQLIKFELEDDFPIPFDDLLTDICNQRNLNEHTREFFVGAVRKSKLQDWVQAISETGLNCDIVTSDACALGSFIKLKKNQNHDNTTVVVYPDDNRIIIAVCQNGSLIFARHIDNIETSDRVSILKKEIELTFREIHDESSSHALSGELTKESDLDVAALNPFEGLDYVSEDKTDNKLTIALGLALTGMNNRDKVLNFIDAEKAGTEQAVKTKRNAFVFAVLLISITVMFVINLFARLNALENEKQNLEGQIRNIFVQTFPDEKKIVNELAQMNEKYNSLEQEYKTVASEIFDRTPALEILANISEKIVPDQNIRISDITMTADSVQLSATAADFESVDNLVEKFKKIPEFSSVDMGNIDLNAADNRVSFNISMKVGVN